MGKFRVTVQSGEAVARQFFDPVRGIIPLEGEMDDGQNITYLVGFVVPDVDTVAITWWDFNDPSSMGFTFRAE